MGIVRKGFQAMFQRGKWKILRGDKGEGVRAREGCGHWLWAAAGAAALGAAAGGAVRTGGAPQHKWLQWDSATGVPGDHPCLSSCCSGIRQACQGAERAGVRVPHPAVAVQIMAGKDKGQVGTVLKVIRDEKYPRVMVEGLNLVSGGGGERLGLPRFLPAALCLLPWPALL